MNQAIHFACHLTHFEVLGGGISVFSRIIFSSSRNKLV